jgi:hypothetical protein
VVAFVVALVAELETFDHGLLFVWLGFTAFGS